MKLPIYKLTQANTAINKIKKNKNNADILIGILTLANLFMSSVEKRKEERQNKRLNINNNKQNNINSIEDIMNLK